MKTTIFNTPILSFSFHILARIIMRLLGWRVDGKLPDLSKFVLIGAPHTSNWDFVFFIGATAEEGVEPNFMGKHTLFRGVMKNFMLDMGGVPVDRTSNKNYVQQMIEEFGRRDEFMLTIAPEGTRGTVKAWKTGFYHIAVGAGVPLVLGMMDYGSKTGGLGPAIWPTGDYKADMAEVAKIYAKVRPKHPAKGMTEIFARDDA